MADWREADRDYFRHHVNCGICIGAGASLARTLPRCEEGARLWRAYQEAGRPEHFAWANKPISNQPMRIKS